jgi:hypothetical protein
LSPGYEAGLQKPVHDVDGEKEGLLQQRELQLHLHNPVDQDLPRLPPGHGHRGHGQDGVLLGQPREVDINVRIIDGHQLRIAVRVGIGIGKGDERFLPNKGDDILHFSLELPDGLDGLDLVLDGLAFFVEFVDFCAHLIPFLLLAEVFNFPERRPLPCLRVLHLCSQCRVQIAECRLQRQKCADRTINYSQKKIFWVPAKEQVLSIGRQSVGSNPGLGARGLEPFGNFQGRKKGLKPLVGGSSF